MKFSISKQEAYPTIKKARQVLKHPGLCIARAKTSHTVGRLLIVVPRIIGTAPERATIKRRLRALFYEQRFYALGFDWVIWVRKEGRDFTYHHLNTLWHDALSTLQ